MAGRNKQAPRARRIGGCVAGVLAAVLAISAQASAHPIIEHRSAGRDVSDIVGGSNDTGDPWLAFVTGIDAQGGFSCTGTVISSNLILTAGHCVADDATGTFYAPGGYTVTTGTDNLADPAGRQVSGVTQSFLDGYDPSTDDRDVGILELSTPTTAPAIQLATSPALLYAGDEVVIAGWGLTDPANANTPDQLQYTSTVVQSPGFCAAHGGANFPFDAATELCTLDAPYDDDSVCYGDSGGPVIANDLQGQPGTPTEIGVIDSSINCSTTTPDYYARVDSFLPWADQLIATLTPPATTESSSSTTKPKTQLFTFPVAQGRADTRTVLDGVFRRAFRQGTNVELDCGRNTRTKIGCGVTWTYGGNDYYGGVTTYLQIYRSKVVWTDHYAIRWVDDHCYFHTQHRARCPVARRAGTF